MCWALASARKNEGQEGTHFVAPPLRACRSLRTHLPGSLPAHTPALAMPSKPAQPHTPLLQRTAATSTPKQRPRPSPAGLPTAGPQVDKAPWLAAWDRQARVLLRLELRSGAVSGGGALADAFNSVAEDEDEGLGAVRLEEVGAGGFSSTAWCGFTPKLEGTAGDSLWRCAAWVCRAGVWCSMEGSSVGR
jgi:hypothetical protein